MSVGLYDEALLKKLQKWCKDTNFTVTGVNETKRLFEVVADSHDDQPLKLPLIALSRQGGFTILNKQRQPITFKGLAVKKTADSTVQLNAIPIDIKYQIDIYARYFEECDEYARNFIFNIINYPKLQVEIPYLDTDLIHYGDIWLNSDVEDNSSIPERLISGQFYRMSIAVNIDNAYLWDVKIRPHYRITGFTVQTPPPNKLKEPVKLDEDDYEKLFSSAK